MNKAFASILIFAAVLLVVIVAVLSYESSLRDTASNRVVDSEYLYRDHAPAYGSDNAKVTIVEFLDPACGACRAFYPLVKQQLEQYGDKVRLEIRMLPFHSQVDQVVTALDAAQYQGKFWQALHVTLQFQDQWAIQHVAYVDKLYPILASAGIDIDKLKNDMTNPNIAKHIAQDSADAVALNVTKTPSFYVNGKPLTVFGYDQLVELIASEVAAQYPQ